MANSSISILKNSCSLKHNDRTGKEPKYLLPPELRKDNECDRTAEEAQALLEDYIKEAKEAYEKKTGQKHQAKVLKFEAVVNLNENHTMQDMQKLNSEIEKRFGFRAVQTAIHRDEGHIDKETNEATYNYHAHVVFCNLDTSGKTLLKNLNREGLKELQDITANTLKMQRGVSAEITKKKHKSHTEFKREKLENELKEERKATQKDLKEEVAKLRAELKEQHATRADYAELEQKHKELKEQLRETDFTIFDLKRKLLEKNKEAIQAILSEKEPEPDPRVEKLNKIDLRAVSELLNVDLKTEMRKNKEDETPVSKQAKKIYNDSFEYVQKKSFFSTTEESVLSEQKLLKNIENVLIEKDKNIAFWRQEAQHFQNYFEMTRKAFNELKALIRPLFTQEKKATIEEPKKKEQEREIQREPIKKSSMQR